MYIRFFFISDNFTPYTPEDAKIPRRRPPKHPGGARPLWHPCKAFVRRPARASGQFLEESKYLNSRWDVQLHHVAGPRRVAD